MIDRAYHGSQLQGIAPDVVLPEGIAFNHRHDDGKDIYFLANQTN